ncbi:MAG: tyrosine-type recombinase/integrase [Actinomycetota bacterium]
MLGLFAGLRTGELHRLCWRDIHVAAGMIEIVGKGAKPATVVAAPQLRMQLEHWHASMRVMAGFSAAWPVLVAPNGNKHDIALREPIKALSIEGIRRVVNRHGATIGIAYLRPHDLRRMLAGTLDARHVPLQDIRLVMRHDTLDATQAYLADNPLRVTRRMRTFTIDL